MNTGSSPTHEFLRWGERCGAGLVGSGKKPGLRELPRGKNGVAPFPDLTVRVWVEDVVPLRGGGSHFEASAVEIEGHGGALDLHLLDRGVPPYKKGPADRAATAPDVVPLCEALEEEVLLFLVGSCLAAERGKTGFDFGRGQVQFGHFASFRVGADVPARPAPAERFFCAIPPAGLPVASRIWDCSHRRVLSVISCNANKVLRWEGR